MVITSEEVTLKLPPSLSPRSPGVHQSAIIRCVAQEYGILKPEWCEELSLADFRAITNPKALLRICIGLAWEEFYIRTQLDDIIDHPAEIRYDGVYMSMDGESMSIIFSQQDEKSKLVLVVHEVKATYKSTNTVGMFDTPERKRKNWMYLAQLMSYCIAKGTRFACLHILFLCSDYKRPIEPVMIKFNFEFTQQELDDNWTFLKDYLEHRMDIENEQDNQDTQTPTL